MAVTTYEKRDWIDAHRAFDSQPEALVAMLDALPSQLAANAPARPERLSVVAIGASHAAAAAPVLRMRQDGIDATRALPSECADRRIGHDGLALFVSQSGRSAEVVAMASQPGLGRAYAVTNYRPSPLGDLCGGELNLGNWPDSSVSFVSFTGTILALGLLSDHWAGRNERGVWTEAIGAASAAVAAFEADLAAVAKMLVNGPSTDFVAPAPIVTVAEEAALMLREGPRLPATGMETRQYLHGPMDMAGPSTHIVFGGAEEALLVDQLAERTSNLVFVTGSDGAAPTADAATVLRLPVPVGDALRFTVAASFVAQRLTLLAAQARGIDINEAVFVRRDTKTDRAEPRP